MAVIGLVVDSSASVEVIMEIMVVDGDVGDDGGDGSSDDNAVSIDGEDSGDVRSKFS